MTTHIQIDLHDLVDLHSLPNLRSKKRDRRAERLLRSLVEEEHGTNSGQPPPEDLLRKCFNLAYLQGKRPYTRFKNSRIYEEVYRETVSRLFGDHRKVDYTQPIPEELTPFLIRNRRPTVSFHGNHITFYNSSCGRHIRKGIEAPSCKIAFRVEMYTGNIEGNHTWTKGFAGESDKWVSDNTEGEWNIEGNSGTVEYFLRKHSGFVSDKMSNYLVDRAYKEGKELSLEELKSTLNPSKHTTKLLVIRHEVPTGAYHSFFLPKIIDRVPGNFNEVRFYARSLFFFCANVGCIRVYRVPAPKNFRSWEKQAT